MGLHQASNGGGVINLFTTDNTGQVKTLTQNPTWGAAWGATGSGHTFNPGTPVSSLYLPNGLIQLFATDNTGQVVTAWLDNMGWHGWANISPPQILDSFPAGAPVSAVLPSNDQLQVFVIDTRGQVVTSWQDPMSGWTGWAQAGSRDTFVVGAPVTTLLTNNGGLINVFATDTAGQVMTTSQNGAWSPWGATGTGDAFSPGAPVAPLLLDTSGMQLFAVDTGGTVQTSWILPPPNNFWSS